jgi:hypothetical protein
MAMEERQRQIKEGAGLEESRLNTEFIEMMKKWGPHLITVVAILMGLYAARDWWNRRVESQADEAFASLERAMPTDNSPANPSVFERLADEHSSSTAVPLEARSIAASIHMEAARTGVPIGEKLDQDNKLPAGKNFLTADEKKQELAKAEALYNTISEKANESLGQTQIAIGALTGLASIAEDRGEFDKAKGFYQRASDKAAARKLDQLKDLIKRRMETLDTLKNPPRLYAMSELPAAEKPITAPLGGITAKTADGKTIQLGGPDGGAVQIPGGGSLVPVAPPQVTDSAGTRPATPEDNKPPAPPTNPGKQPDAKPAEPTPPATPPAPKPGNP